MKRKIFSLFLSTVMVLSLCINASASANTNESLSTKIKLHDISVSVPYKDSEITTTRIENDNKCEVVIKDKKTGKVLTTIGEMGTDQYPLNKKVSTFAAGSTYQRIIYGDCTEDPVTARLYTNIEIYEYNSFRQINKVVSTWWAAITSGTWTLEDKYCSSYLDATPGSVVSSQGTAVVQIVTSSSVSGQWSVSALKALGYSLTLQTGGNYYARKPISYAYSYSLY